MIDDYVGKQYRDWVTGMMVMRWTERTLMEKLFMCGVGDNEASLPAMEVS